MGCNCKNKALLNNLEALSLLQSQYQNEFEKSVFVLNNQLANNSGLDVLSTQLKTISHQMSLLDTVSFVIDNMKEDQNEEEQAQLDEKENKIIFK
jgi:hypothetical protein